jgi:A/G-specific adenine glycosylase
MKNRRPALPAAPRIMAIRRGLLRWFRRHARPLPWRRDRDPYRIWVSEAMLQQTQVATVIPYYDRFLARFPTLAALARADLSEVLRLWEGLGYYRRARHLHAAARAVVSDHDGVVPREPAAFAALPGVGRYTVGAVLSQAYDLPLPLVDGNVQRALARLFLRAASANSTSEKRWAWTMAQKLLPRRAAGAFNQSLMELGQVICVPRRPLCRQCPLTKCCAAHRAGRQNRIPAPRPAVKVSAVNEVAAVIQSGRRYLLVQRPDDALRWAGLWEFPHGERLADETERACARRLAQALTGWRIAPRRRLTTIRHTITRFRITLDCWLAEPRAGRWRSAFYRAHAWVTAAELTSYPLSKPQRELARVIVR